MSDALEQTKEIFDLPQDATAKDAARMMSPLGEMRAMFAGPADETDAATLDQAGQVYLQAKEAADRAKAAKEAADAAEKNARQGILAALDRAGVVSAKLKSGHTVTKVPKKHFSIPSRKEEPGLRKEALTWLRRHKLGELVYLDVNHQTLGASLRAYEENNKDAGKTVPTDLFRIHEETILSIRKG